MTSMTERPTPSLDVLLALCCVCGATRTVSRRAVGCDGNRPLRCETCRKTTTHAAIAAEGDDYREELNRQERDRQRKSLAEFHAVLDVMLGMMTVTFGPLKQEYNGVNIDRYVDDPREFEVQIDETLTLEEQATALRWAWKWLLPGSTDSWDDAAVYEVNGRQAVGIHRTSTAGR